MTEDDVLATLERLRRHGEGEAATAAVAGLSPERLGELAATAGELAVMELCGDFAQLIDENGGTQLLVDILQVGCWATVTVTVWVSSLLQ